MEKPERHCIEAKISQRDAKATEFLRTSRGAVVAFATPQSIAAAVPHADSEPVNLLGDLLTLKTLEHMISSL